MGEIIEVSNHRGLGEEKEKERLETEEEEERKNTTRSRPYTNIFRPQMMHQKCLDIIPLHLLILHAADTLKITNEKQQEEYFRIRTSNQIEMRV